MRKVKFRMPGEAELVDGFYHGVIPNPSHTVLVLVEDTKGRLYSRTLESVTFIDKPDERRKLLHNGREYTFLEWRDVKDEDKAQYYVKALVEDVEGGTTVLHTWEFKFIS